jgi:hypothetical protein
MRNFKVEDFEGSGQYLIRMSLKEIYERNLGNVNYQYENIGFLSTLMKKVGYIRNLDNIGNGFQLITLTDMSDGCTYIGNFTAKDINSNNYEREIWQADNDEDDDGGTRKLVEWLNNSELSQEHRFATQDEVVKVVMHQSSKWRN